MSFSLLSDDEFGDLDQTGFDSIIATAGKATHAPTTRDTKTRCCLSASCHGARRGPLRALGQFLSGTKPFMTEKKRATSTGFFSDDEFGDEFKELDSKQFDLMLNTAEKNRSDGKIGNDLRVKKKLFVETNQSIAEQEIDTGFSSEDDFADWNCEQFDSVLEAAGVPILEAAEASGGDAKMKMQKKATKSEIFQIRQKERTIGEKEENVVTVSGVGAEDKLKNEAKKPTNATCLYVNYIGISGIKIPILFSALANFQLAWCGFTDAEREKERQRVKKETGGRLPVKCKRGDAPCCWKWLLHQLSTGTSPVEKGKVPLAERHTTGDEEWQAKVLGLYKTGYIATYIRKAVDNGSIERSRLDELFFALGIEDIKIYEEMNKSFLQYCVDRTAEMQNFQIHCRCRDFYGSDYVCRLSELECDEKVWAKNGYFSAPASIGWYSEDGRSVNSLLVLRAASEGKTRLISGHCFLVMCGCINGVDGCAATVVWNGRKFAPANYLWYDKEGVRARTFEKSRGPFTLGKCRTWVCACEGGQACKAPIDNGDGTKSGPLSHRWLDDRFMLVDSLVESGGGDEIVRIYAKCHKVTCGCERGTRCTGLFDNGNGTKSSPASYVFTDSSGNVVNSFPKGTGPFFLAACVSRECHACATRGNWNLIHTRSPLDPSKFVCKECKYLDLFPNNQSCPFCDTVWAGITIDPDSMRRWLKKFGIEVSYWAKFRDKEELSRLACAGCFEDAANEVLQELEWERSRAEEEAAEEARRKAGIFTREQRIAALAINLRKLRLKREKENKEFEQSRRREIEDNR